MRSQIEEKAVIWAERTGRNYQPACHISQLDLGTQQHEDVKENHNLRPCHRGDHLELVILNARILLLVTGEETGCATDRLFSRLKSLRHPMTWLHSYFAAMIDGYVVVNSPAAADVAAYFSAATPALLLLLNTPPCSAAFFRAIISAAGAAAFSVAVL